MISMLNNLILTKHNFNFLDESQEKQTTPTALFGGFLSGFATAVQTTVRYNSPSRVYYHLFDNRVDVYFISQGIGIMSGGLDALEAIGRKTVDIISEGDPGEFIF